jgi:hypothetical protein
MGTRQAEPDYVSRSLHATPHPRLVHAQREHRARREHEAVEIDRHLIGIEDRHERNCRQTAYEGSDGEFDCE